jgi:hypothetical protein
LFHKYPPHSKFQIIRTQRISNSLHFGEHLNSKQTKQHPRPH